MVVFVVGNTCLHGIVIKVAHFALRVSVFQEGASVVVILMVTVHESLREPIVFNGMHLVNQIIFIPTEVLFFRLSH
jgi:hypothetical protein